MRLLALFSGSATFLDTSVSKDGKHLPLRRVRFFGRSIRSVSIMRRLVAALATSSALNHENAALVAYFYILNEYHQKKKEKQKKNSKNRKIERKIIIQAS
jgi:hypothetical protein